MFKRDDRIVSLLQTELATLLRSVKDPGIEGLVTITSIDLSADRKHAAVYFSVFGDAAQKESTQKALQRAANYLRYQLKGRLQMRTIPNLEFQYDDTPERAQRVEDILNRLSSGDEDSSQNPADKPKPPARRPKIK